MKSRYVFHKAVQTDVPQIWTLLKGAIERRKAEGSNQWQDGYPNLEVIYTDITKKVGYVLICSSEVVGYCAILINDEPAYKKLQGRWISTGDFVVFHRLAVASFVLGKGIAKKLFVYIESIALEQNIYSIKADTNYDNSIMLHLFEKMGYTYCGKVEFRGSPRLAYEKLLIKD